MKTFETKGINFSKKTSFGKIAILFIALFTFSPSNILAQEKKELVKYEDVKDIENYGDFKFVEVIGHGGSHFYSGQTIEEDALSTGYGALELRFGWKSGDPEHWSNKYYNSMSYGVGFYTGFIGDPQVFGNPNAIYGFADFPVGRQSFQRKTYWKFSPALGVTYNLAPYNPTGNPTNDAIGASFAVYIALAGKGETMINRDMDITYGIDFTHFSNGRSFMPNYGLNMIGFNVGAKYHFNTQQKKVNNDPFTTELLPSRYKRTRNTPAPKKVGGSINILTAVGTVQNGFDENENGGDPDNRYTTFSGYIDYTYKFNMKMGVDVGIDFFYDQSLIIETPEDPDDLSLLAFHVGYEYTFWRFTVISQLGGYIGGDNGKGKIWARPGVQYKLTDWVSAHVALKTRRGFAADWAEFGVVFHPFSW